MENNDYYEPTIKTARNNKQFKEDLLNVCGNFAKTSLDCIEKQNNELEQLQNEKQQLISFLEDKIRENEDVMEMSIDSLNEKFADKKDEENVKRTLKITIRECEIEIKSFQEALDFVNKGGKDE